jgi:cytochrome P450
VSAADTRIDAEDLLPFTDPAYWHDPYPYYDRVRAATPVYASPAGVHVLTRHEDIAALIRDPRMSALELSFGVGDRFHDSVLGQDPPDHTRLRKVFQRWFSGSRVRDWAADTRARAEASLDRADAAGGTLDLIDDYAFPATFGTISYMFGVSTDAAEDCRHHTYVIGRALAPGADDADMAAGDASFEWYYAYVRGLIARKRRAPGDDLLSAFVTAVGDQTMTENEVLATMTLLYSVGHLDNTYLIANGILEMLRSPELRRRYVTDPASRGATILELLRHETPEQFVVRAAKEAMAIGGETIPARAVVMLMIGAANRDPAVFADPGRIDIDRPNVNRQLAFGGGIHACIGSGLARAQGEAGVTAVLERYRSLALAGEVEFGHTEFLRVIRHLPVRLG